ncbi:hypothetical protein BJV74DRAFT_863045 [Russula compacta]|nr:hypothetical protein BJV74DRAFT_863045 [Russula compacta]
MQVKRRTAEVVPRIRRQADIRASCDVPRIVGAVRVQRHPMRPHWPASRASLCAHADIYGALYGSGPQCTRHHPARVRERTLPACSAHEDAILCPSRPHSPPRARTQHPTALSCPCHD